MEKLFVMEKLFEIPLGNTRDRSMHALIPWIHDTSRIYRISADREIKPIYPKSDNVRVSIVLCHWIRNIYPMYPIIRYIRVPLYSNLDPAPDIKNCNVLHY